MKQVPDENILLFKSCLVSVEYPGIESSTKFVFDKIGIDYDISDIVMKHAMNPPVYNNSYWST